MELRSKSLTFATCVLQWKYMSSMFGADTAGKALFVTVPAWLIATQYLLHPQTSGLGSVTKLHLFKYYLPPDHNLYEHRSLRDCVVNTSLLALPSVLMHFYPQPVVDNASFSIMATLGALLRGLTADFMRDYTSWFIGNAVAYPLKKVYAR